MNHNPNDNSAPAHSTEETLTGTLTGGIFAIGGETTGWQIEVDNRSIEVDVSAIRPQADEWQGQRVVLHGTFITRDYIERGATRIFAASAIEPVE